MIKLLSLITTGALISTPAINISKNSDYHTIEKQNPIVLNLNTNSTQIENINAEKVNSNIDIFGSGGGMIGHKASENEIKNFSNLVPNYQWFTKLNSEKSFGYTDLTYLQGASGKGLCEDISLSTILTYQELFVSSGFFSDNEWEQYFGVDLSNDKVKIPIHNYYKNNNALSYKLYQLTGKTDLWWGSDVNNTFLKFLNNKTIKSKVGSDYCASTMHSSSPEKYLLKNNVPVMVSFTKNGGHNVVIYGYDSKTNSYLVHYGWSGAPAVIIKKSEIWSFWSTGFWNAFYFNSSANKNPPRKAFEYQNQKYSWNEIKNKGFNWNDISIK